MIDIQVSKHLTYCWRHLHLVFKLLSIKVHTCPLTTNVHKQQRQQLKVALCILIDPSKLGLSFIGSEFLRNVEFRLECPYNTGLFKHLSTCRHEKRSVLTAASHIDSNARHYTNDTMHKNVSKRYILCMRSCELYWGSLLLLYALKLFTICRGPRWLVRVHMLLSPLGWNSVLWTVLFTLKEYLSARVPLRYIRCNHACYLWYRCLSQSVALLLCNFSVYALPLLFSFYLQIYLWNHWKIG